jgi:hypothetical protein
MARAILSKKSNTGAITIHDFKLYYKGITIQVPWYWPQTDMKTNGTEIMTQINPCN